MATSTVDYIIIGAGAAGSVLASRLTEDPENVVHVLEAGPSSAGLMSKIPAALDYALHDDKFNWDYYTDPEPYLNGRRLACPRGRVVGGSSTINGMMFIRGNPNDFNEWSEKQLPNWSYKHCLPYFKKLENFEGGADDYRGDSGPLHVSRGTIKNPLEQAFFDATLQAGHIQSKDTNGYQQEGFGLSDRNTWKGQRWSALDAYLKPAMKRQNLGITTDALTCKILFDQKRAIGVEYDHAGQRQKLYADKEVLLCGGTINSPQTLMLSGLGDAGHLKQHDISVLQHMPGVGSNLQDHVDLVMQRKCKLPVSIYPWTKGTKRIAAGLQWILTKRGICASNQFEIAGYLRTRSDISYPNLQSSFVALASSYNGNEAFYGHGYQAHLDLMRPSSRGQIRLKSKNPAQHPSIVFNYLQSREDQQEVIDAVHITRDIFQQNALSKYDGGEITPLDNIKSDVDILAWARENTQTEYHPTSSCAMGMDDSSVVDGELKVHGIEGLRVVDASIMPTIVTANTHAATLMIAEKAVDLILNKSPLPALQVPLYS